MRDLRRVGVDEDALLGDDGYQGMEGPDDVPAFVLSIRSHASVAHLGRVDPRYLSVARRAIRVAAPEEEEDGDSSSW